MLRNGLEPWHLLIVGLVVILLFGSRKLPDTARALGKSLRILKSETKAMKRDGTDAGPPPAEPAPYATFHTPDAAPGPAPAAPAPASGTGDPAPATPAHGTAGPAAQPLPPPGTARPAGSGGSAPVAVPATGRGTGDG